MGDGCTFCAIVAGSIDAEAREHLRVAMDEIRGVLEKAETPPTPAEMHYKPTVSETFGVALAILLGVVARDLDQHVPHVDVRVVDDVLGDLAGAGGDALGGEGLDGELIIDDIARHVGAGQEGDSCHREPSCHGR